MRQTKAGSYLFGGRLTAEDLSIIEAAKAKLGIRSTTEVLRIGLRSLAREHDLHLRIPEHPIKEET